MKNAHWLSVLGVSLYWVASQSAHAQEADTSASALQEVVVTAERRSENLQDVPIDVGVVNSATLQRFEIISNVGLDSQIPSLQTSRQNTGATIYLRGVGTITAPGVENAVATYVDDVYITGFASTIVGFNNVDRVEVLKGPQGTLFGRNATGGVIHVVTKDPSSTPSVDAQIGYGNFNTLSGNIYATGPLAQNLAGDIAFEVRDQSDGYGHDFTTGQDTNLGREWSVRGKLKWTPGERTTIVAAAEYYTDDYDYGINQTSVPGTLSSGLGTFAGDWNTQGNNPYAQPPGRSGHSRDVDGEYITIAHEFDWATLKSITARRYTTDFVSYDQDGGPGHYNDARYPLSTESYSEELHLASNEDATLFGRKFHWLGGLFFLKLNDRITLYTSGDLLGGGLLYEGFSENYTKSYAAFYDATLELAPATNLTLGVRETADRIHNKSSTSFTAGNGQVFDTAFPDQDADATKPTYRAVLDHNFTDEVMGYVSVSRGFKSGGFSTFGPGTPPTQPEIVDAYTLGAKTEWAEHRLQVNTEAFFYNYKNQQVQIIEGGGLVGINAAKSRIYGADLSVTARATETLTFNANVGFLEGQYLDFPNAPIYLQQPATCAPTPTRLPGPLVPGNLLCSFDGSGKPTIRSPKWSGNLGANWRVLQGQPGSVDLALNYFYTSSFNWDISGQFPEPAYGLLDASLTWTAPNGHYDVRVYCSNCADKYHNTFIAESGPEQQMAGADPRFYGVKFGVHF